ncbi:hypothetical protein [Geodermatophilus sp. DSM 44513]|uniref:hypothetical protein n=1 Tax=Geodermatophilus sp. DSM 44513 TaxID=1528104 RepID=UPI0028F6D4DF|nr:hypothetical protein [Geodermatophilus sp. DSM 44513]WNV74331.1 hypothetical protein RTG05_15210 [Geodermatophilus sp. DSM 44513]
MSTPQEPATEGTSADHTRSGADVAEAIEVAERGSAAPEGHGRAPGPGPAPVERTAGDPAMTQGQVVQADGTPTGGTGAGPAAPEGVGGGAQSVQGARAADREAAGPSGHDS